jgi:hypothetical protein
MVTSQQPEQQETKLDEILDIESWDVKSARRFLTRAFEEFGGMISKEGPVFLIYLASVFERRYGKVGLVKILSKKGLEYFKHKIGFKKDLGDFLNFNEEPSYSDLSKLFKPYYLRRTEAAMLLHRLGKSIPRPDYSYGSMRDKNGNRLVDDYGNYQSVFWATKNL